MKKVQGALAFYAYKLAAMLMVLLISSPAFAGQQGGGAFSAVGNNLKSILDDVMSLLTGPVAMVLGSIIIVVALIGAWFQGGMESFKKALLAVCILGMIVAVPTMMNTLFGGMGALI